MIIIDAHTHVFDPVRNADMLLKHADRFGYEKINVLAVPAYAGLSQNLACLYLKKLRPAATYAFGGLEYVSGTDFAKQAELLIRMGFDGCKMIEGKPTIRKELSLALDDKAYDGFYDYLERNRLPLLLHAADPADFWDEARIPAWALQAGMLYDNSYAPYETFYGEVEHVLEKHPSLRLILAHFFFLSDDRARAARFLEEHPSTYFDVTSGFEMYENFSKAPDEWRKFFIRYSDRLIYGTDTTDSTSDQERHIAEVINGAQLHCLSKTDSYQAWDKTIPGMQLPEADLRKIFFENFEGLAGQSPAPIHEQRIAEYGQRLMLVAATHGMAEDERRIRELLPVFGCDTD